MNFMDHFMSIQVIPLETAESMKALISHFVCTLINTAFGTWKEFAA